MAQANPSKRSVRALEGANFFLSDVREGLGPFITIFLSSSALAWSEANIGLALAVVSLATLIAQTPAGALIDATCYKRTLILVSSLAVGGACLMMVLAPNFLTIMAGQSIIGVAAAVFQPALGAITLGLVGRYLFSRQIGRNEAFNHGGNVFFAVVSLVLGSYYGPEAIFFLVAILGPIAGLSIMLIRENEIDHNRAREMQRTPDPDERKPSGFRVLLENRTLLIFTVCVTLFHFANAAMLPLVSKYAATKLPDEQATGAVALCIIFAQLIMIPMAILVGREVDRWGRKPLFLLGFAILPIRGFLYTLWDNPYYLVSVQLLDGIGAGIYGALVFIVLADIMRGTGRYNIAQGAVLTVVGVGMALSNWLGFVIEGWYGFNTAFYFLTAIALIAFCLYLFAMPETRPKDIEELAELTAPADGLGEGQPKEENSDGK